MTDKTRETVQRYTPRMADILMALIGLAGLWLTSNVSGRIASLERNVDHMRFKLDTIQIAPDSAKHVTTRRTTTGYGATAQNPDARAGHGQDELVVPDIQDRPADDPQRGVKGTALFTTNDSGHVPTR